MATKRAFWNCLLPKVTQVIGWPSWAYAEIKKISDGQIFLKRANEHLFVSGQINVRVDDMGIKMSSK